MLYIVFRLVLLKNGCYNNLDVIVCKFYYICSRGGVVGWRAKCTV